MNFRWAIDKVNHEKLFAYGRDKLQELLNPHFVFISIFTRSVVQITATSEDLQKAENHIPGLVLGDIELPGQDDEYQENKTKDDSTPAEVTILILLWSCNVFFLH